VQKNGEKFREETGSFKRSAFARFRNFLPFFSLGNVAGGLSLWFVSLSAERKRNEHAQ
jgi:hypothetical protein